MCSGRDERTRNLTPAVRTAWFFIARDCFLWYAMAGLKQRAGKRTDAERKDNDDPEILRGLIRTGKKCRMSDGNRMNSILKAVGKKYAEGEERHAVEKQV